MLQIPRHNFWLFSMGRDVKSRKLFTLSGRSRMTGTFSLILNQLNFNFFSFFV